MHTTSKHISYLLILLSILWTTTKLDAKKIDHSFNADVVIRRVTQNHYLTGTRYNDFLIDTNIAYSSAAMQQSDPSVSFDGTNYFVVWGDSRMTGAFQGDIFGARVSQSGSILDPVNIFISEDGWAPAVAFDGMNYFVVWSNNDIYGIRVNPSGLIIDTSRIIIATDSIPEDQPAVSFDGTNYLVIWSTNSELYCARVSQGGVVLDSIPIPIASACGYIRRPSVAYGDTCYLVVWSEYWGDLMWNIYGKRVSRDGVVLDTVPIWFDWSMNLVDPDVAFDGTNYLVVWELWNDINGKRVNQAGALIDTNPIVVMEGQVPSVAFDGTNYLVVCDVGPLGKDIYGVRVDTSGTVVDTEAIAISTAPEFQRYPVVAFDGTSYLVVWQDERNGFDCRDIYGARVTQTVEVLDSVGIEISGAVNSQHYPAVAFGGVNYLTVWQDNRNESWDIYGIKVDTTGIVLDTGITISSAGYDQLVPSVAFGNTNYFVAWQDERSDSGGDIYGARVDVSGVVVDPLGFVISAAIRGQSSPSVAFDGSNYLVVWTDLRNNEYYTDIYAARVSQGGILLDPTGIAISTASYDQIFPTVAFDGTNYLVVWADRRTWLSWDIYGARISASGTVIDTDIAISTATNWRSWPLVSVAFDGVNYLVVWEDDRNNPNILDIYGARVDTSGVVLDTVGIAISTASGQQRCPVVAFDGSDYLVLWEDFRSDSTSDIYGAKVSTSGEVLNNYVVSTQIGKQLSPALVRGNADRILAIYSGWTDSINTYPANTMRIWGIFYPFIGIEENVGSMIRSTEPNLRIYPNPFHNECIIRYYLPQETHVHISLYDVVGRLIKEIIKEKQNAGNYNKVMKITDLTQGVYFIRLKTHDESLVEKVIFLK